MGTSGKNGDRDPAHKENRKDQVVQRSGGHPIRNGIIAVIVLAGMIVFAFNAEDLVGERDASMPPAQGTTEGAG